MVSKIRFVLSVSLVAERAGIETKQSFVSSMITDMMHPLKMGHQFPNLHRIAAHPASV